MRLVCSFRVRLLEYESNASLGVDQARTTLESALARRADRPELSSDTVVLSSGMLAEEGERLKP